MVSVLWQEICIPEMLLRCDTITLWPTWKFEICSEATYTCSDGFLDATMLHWRNSTLWSETVQTVPVEQITILWLRVDIKNWKYHFLEFFSFTMATRLCFLHSIVRPLANVHFHKDDLRCYVYSVMSNMIMKCSYDVYHQLGPRLKKLIFFQRLPRVYSMSFFMSP